MSFANYRWNSTAEIRAHFSEERRKVHERYAREGTEIERKEIEALAEFRKIAALGK